MPTPFHAIMRAIANHMRSIELFGRPSAALVEQFRAKSKLLGSGTVIIRDLHAGFARLGLG
ncbi:hypothetical protein [Arthrobacter pascens]|uniref:hypothetical protein n=1 Tax=Arthrobacter pascens TaxID=1677 RepID=UPI0027D812D7|nr:hypothetical protein [Arthrobacter pascens]